MGEILTCRTDRLCDQLVQNVFLVMFRDGSDNGGQGRYIGKLVLLGQLGSQRVEVNISGGLAVLGRLMVFNQGVGNIGTASKESLALSCKVGTLLLRRRHR